MTRFLKKRTDPITDRPELFEAIKKVLIAEKKTLNKVRKRAKKQNIEVSEIHTQLMLYAIREHIRGIIKGIEKNHFLPKK